MAVQPFIVGNPVLVVVDIQNGDPPSPDGDQTIPHMESDGSWVARAAALIGKCREVNVPIVFIQEAHRRDLVDFGRELDGQEDFVSPGILAPDSDEIGMRTIISFEAPILLLF